MMRCMRIEELLIQILSIIDTYIRLIFNIIDVYLRLILTSWPAVVLILFLLLFFRHREAIDNRIRNLKSISKTGLEFGGPPGSEKVEISNDELPLSGTAELPDVMGSNIALVECKIASSLPSTVAFDFLRDWKVWFWIANREPKKYRAYVKVKFIADGYEKELDEGYYGGIKAWNLNAFSGIQAPGLGIPNEIKEAAKQGKKIKIEINCTVKDENDKLVEKKLPNVYAYEYERKYWYLEP